MVAIVNDPEVVAAMQEALNLTEAGDGGGTGGGDADDDKVAEMHVGTLYADDGGGEMGDGRWRRRWRRWRWWRPAGGGDGGGTLRPSECGVGQDVRSIGHGNTADAATVVATAVEEMAAAKGRAPRVVANRGGR